MAQQNGTRRDGTRRLTPQQEAALDLLATGHTITETARRLGAGRATVSAWVNVHAGFQDALKARRGELWRETIHRLQALLPKALDVLAAKLDDDEEALSAAVHVIKACGIYGERFNV